MDDIRLRRLQIDEGDASEEQKRIERQRLNALISLAEAPKCRRQTLLAYFGDESEPCGNCDLCSGDIERFDGKVDAQKALSAMLRTGERFGMEHVIAVLRGDANEKVRRFGHDELPTFGVGKERSQNEWRAIFRQLYALGIATVDLSDYGAWRLGPQGRAALKGEMEVMLRLDPLKERGGGRKARASDAPPPDVDQTLLDALKAKRRELASAQGVPAYVVFADRTLIDIAARKPTTLAEFAEVHGVGAAKLERYGETFTAVVAEAEDA